MKRSFDEMISNLSTLPTYGSGDRRTFESKLEGTIRLRVVKSVDISKPADKPVEEIEEPEEEEVARQNTLNKSNARMMQLDLRDSNGTSIKAIEKERIDMLTDVKPGNIVTIAGPVDVRCGNIMLEKRHMKCVEKGPEIEPDVVQVVVEESEREAAPVIEEIVEPEVIQVLRESVKPEVIDCAEDWDEEEEDDDCIILD